MKSILLATAAAHGWAWDVALEFNPDAVLARRAGLVATSDSVVLDRCERWLDAAREIIAAGVPVARVVDLRDQPV